MQWNANGICPKLLELCDKIINSVSDIVATPESKLRKADKTPSIEGYSTIRKDWNNILGNGLLFFIYNSMIFEKLQSLKKTGMEILSIWVRTSKSLWIEIYNVYIPNMTTKQSHFDPNLINPFLHSIIIGDFNVHSHLWDHFQPPNTWGDKITDWIINKDLHVLINGSATLTSRITGNDSTPNLLLYGCNWSIKTSWSLAEPIGSSDCLPVSIVINHIIRYQPAIPRKAWWCCNGIHWSSFIKEIESQMQQLLEECNISIRISRFSNIIKSSASLHVGRPKPSKKSKPWINPPVWRKICQHNRLHRTIHQNRQECINACWEANVAINEAKDNSWMDLLHSSVSKAGKPDVWSVIWGLNSTPDTNSSNETMSHNGQTITNTKSKTIIFINHYARVSKVHMTKEDRCLNWLQKMSQCSISWQQPLHLHQHLGTLISNSEGEMQRSCWPRQYSTNIPQITWSFSSPGNNFHIQCFIPPRWLSTNLESCYHNCIVKSW